MVEGFKLSLAYITVPGRLQGLFAFFCNRFWAANLLGGHKNSILTGTPNPGASPEATFFFNNGISLLRFSVLVPLFNLFFVGPGYFSGGRYQSYALGLGQESQKLGLIG
jgi:hypothetical protein